MAARASRLENQDAIDASRVGMLADPKEVCFEIIAERVLNFLFFISIYLFLLLLP